MGAGGQYTIRVHGVLDDAQIRAQLASLGKQSGAIMGGGKKGKTSGAFGAIGKDAGKAQKQVKGLNTAIDTTNKKVKQAPKIAGGYAHIGKGAQQSTKDVKKFGSTTLDVTKKVVQFGAVTAVIRGVTSGIGSMVQQTFELDSALTEFKKVSDLSGKGLEKYTEQAYKAGRETAKTGVEMIDAATQFKKMGYNEETSMQLAKHATMFQNIADAEISAGDAAKFINSQMKAYQDEFSGFSTEGEKAAKVIDTVNEVANKNAVGTNDLQLALTKTSAAMGGFGNSFDQTVGIMTAGTEIMVGMPSQVARGWRTIAANILNVAQSSDEYVAASGKVKIATRDQNGEMKNTYEMMKDLYEGQEGVSKGWKELSKEEQSAIALELAGKNNMEKFRAVMDNFGTAIKATTDAQNSQGSAAKENARFLDSMEGSLQNLKSAWSEFANAMVDSGTLKTMMNGLAEFIRFMSGDFGQAILKGGLALAGLGASFKLVGGLVSSITSPFTKVSGILKKVGKNSNTAGTGMAGLARAINPLTIGFGILAGVAVASGIGIYKAYKNTHKYRKEVSDLTKENDKSIESIDSNAQHAQFLAQTIERLNGVENKSKAQKELLKQAVDELNEMYPDLNLQYDEEKDKVNKSASAIRDYIKAQQEKAKIQAYETGFQKAIEKQLSLEEKRAKAQKKFNELDKRQQEAKKSGYVDPQLQKEWDSARKSLEDVTQAYSNATKEATKQSNGMVKASGAWKELAKDAKDAGVEISDGVKNGIEEGVYAIPQTVQGLENLNMFDDLAGKLGATDAGKGLVDALQLGMREGNLKPSEALKIAEGFQDVQKDIGVEGKKAVEELSNAFANGEIDFGTFEKGMKELTELRAKPKIEADDKDFKKKEKDVKKDTKNLNKTKGKVKVDANTKSADKKLKKTTKATKKLNKTKGKVKVDADTKKADKKVKKTTKSLKKYSKQKPKVKLDADPSNAKKGTETATKSVETFSGKEAIAYLKEHGGEAVKATVDDVGNTILTMPDGKTVTITETGAKGGEKNVSGLNKQIKQTKGKSVSVNASTSGKGGITSLQQAINSVKGKTVTVTVNYKKNGNPGKAKGGIAKNTGLTEVNEEGWEFIRDAKTGALRIAGGGKRTVTLLGKGDAVYTHAESKRMMSQEDDIHISQHASGSSASKKKKAKKKAQEKYNKAYEKRKTSYENAVDKLEFTAGMQHWSDEGLANEIQKAYNKHIASLKKWNKGKYVKKLRKKGAKVKNSFGTDLYREAKLGVEEAVHDTRLKNIEKQIESFGFGGGGDDRISASDVSKQESSLATMRKKNQISAEEYQDYLKEIRQAYIENGMKLVASGKKTYKDMRADLDSYAKSGKITWAEYYDYLEELLEKQLENEQKALEKRQKTNEETYSLATSWIDRKIESLEKEKEELDEQNQLIELQSNLEKARSQRVKVYRQGQGFVYEQDTEAIKEATQALQDYKKEQDSPELRQLKKIKEILEQAEIDAEIANLEARLGKSFEQLFEGLGTDEVAWTNWAQASLSERYGIENILEEMEELEGWEAIQNFFKGANATISEAQLNSYINNVKNRFATGTLNAPAGLARVAENGYEIALLGRGDAVMPHNISENLMQWGQYSPLEVMQAGGATTTQSFNFDKLILPNVTNADQFIRELNNLPNKAIQSAWSRGA